ncbi:MAG TPA: PilW family protein [Steroidobacteraceae bacterium]|jgi:type IV pilus assembly protein PilW|nr:PilW family protein [Steroidobacteraceae bacterium]
MITITPIAANRRRRARPARGFTLVELMVALAIGLLVTVGILTLLGAMRRTSTSQTGLSTLQENQRIAMSLITDMVQTAGYYPNPVTNSPTTFFTSVSTPTTMASGQFIAGADSTSDTLYVRYATSGTDYVIDCSGNTYSVGSQTTLTSSLSVVNGYLQCVLNGGTAIQLVSGIQSMQILYGVESKPGSTNNSVDAYVTATNVPDWTKVLTVKVTLYFVSPLYGQPGQSTVPQYIPFTRVITLMNKTGVDS